MEGNGPLFEDSENLERIADALEALVISANQIATALGLKTLHDMTHGSPTE